MFTFTDESITCCVCYTTFPILYIQSLRKIAQLVDVSKNDLDKIKKVVGNIVVKSSCNIHYICISCIKTIVTNYLNHPINENNSHFSCPYPFKECLTSVGSKNIFEHNQIQKILDSTIEWSNYKNHYERFAFPGFTIVKCPQDFCKMPILVETDLIKYNTCGDLIVKCSQNPTCLKRFCYDCKKILRYDWSEEITECSSCKLCYENENPHSLNYFINKNPSLPLNNIFEESDYLYYNNEITVEFAKEYIINTIRNLDSHIICPICKISMYKTERCNTLTHHNIDRCYSCGRIGNICKGLYLHWDPNGIDGCFRFDSDMYVKYNVDTFLCEDLLCYNHNSGDCVIPHHQQGILDLYYLRHKQCIYHLFNSLLPTIRYQVFDELYNEFSDDPVIIEFLPYKQTLILVESFKNHIKDCSENVVYYSINCEFPSDVLDSKISFIDSTSFVEKYYKWDR